MHFLPYLIGGITSIFAGNALRKLIFKDNDDFWECFSFSVKPDFISLFQGQYLENMGKTFKFSCWIFMTLFCGLGVGYAAQKLLLLVA
jgi:hypothetical protein